MSSCGYPETAFYSTRYYRFGDWSEFKTTPTTNGNQARCGGPGFDDGTCPANWEFVRRTSQGCNDSTRHRAMCRFTGYPTDDKTLARCCLGEHKVGKLNDKGVFPSNAKPCPPDYCDSKQSSSKCEKVLQNYCAEQFAAGRTDNKECWRWAKENWPEGIDNFCRDVGSGKGWGIENNAQCKEFVDDKRSSGKMDNSVTAYCQSDLGKRKEICSCFPEAANLSSKAKSEAEKLGAPLSCWSDECRNKGYITKTERDRMKNCGDFCGQVVEAKGDIDIAGSFIAEQACADSEAAAQTAEQLEEVSSEPAGNGDQGSASGVGTGLLIAIGSAIVLAVVFFSYLIYLALGSDEEEVYESPPLSQFSPAQPGSSPFPAYQIGTPQRFQTMN